MSKKPREPDPAWDTAWDPELDPDEDLTIWTDRLEETLTNAKSERFDRVQVLAETTSTQDAAPAHAGGKPGLVLTCGHQTGGRGRFNRQWVQPLGLGVAVTFVVDGSEHDDATLSLAAGLAACRACEAALGVAKGQQGVTATLSAIGGPLGMAAAALIGKPSIGLRWPNDVVERKGMRRKLAGVLIERTGDLALIGVGVNTHQHEVDWPDELLASAVSLAQLRGGAPGFSRYQLIERLTLELDDALDLKPKRLAALWQERNALLNTEAVFDCAGERVHGAVLSIDPANEIVVKTTKGKRKLPAATTTLIHDPDPDDIGPEPEIELP